MTHLGHEGRFVAPEQGDAAQDCGLQRRAQCHGWGAPLDLGDRHGVYPDPLGQLGAHGPADPVEWELFDLVADPLETTNVIADDRYADVVAALRAELTRLQAELGDVPVVSERARDGMSQTTSVTARP